MAGFRDFLTRFRPASTPGPAVAGVPADRTAELAAELEPPLSLLDEAESEARALREAAGVQAEEIRREGDRRAALVVAQAHLRVDQVREETAARMRDAAQAEAAELLDAGEREAASIRRRAQERMPALVDRVVAEVRQEISTFGGPGEGRSRWAPGGSPG